MRIGILTFHRSINNGAFMQAYALSHQIKKRFGDIVEIIDFEQETKHESYKKNSLNKLIVYGGKYKSKYNKFQKDLDLLPLSPQKIIANNYDVILKYIEDRYDTVIVGSDAVWNYSKGLGLDNPYWLFGNKLQVNKLSYAASAFGVDFKNIPQNERDFIAESLESFFYIGVRDSETKNFLKSIDSNLKIYRNCDPTVLLDKPSIDTSRRILEKYGVNLNKKIVGIMLSNSDYMRKIQRYLGENEYQFIDIHRRHYSRNNYYLSTNKSLFDLSPFEWYHIYRNVFLNFTNFFHGTLLGLKSDVPTFSLDAGSHGHKYLSKIEQLLTDLDLSDYWIDNTQYTKEEENRILAQVDYTIKNYENIQQKISDKMNEESKRANSFFDHLSKLF